MLRILESEHDDIEGLLAEALGYLMTVDDIEPAGLGDYRFRFDRWLKRHLEFLGGTVGPALRTEGSRQALAIESRLTAATLELWDIYNAHVARFPIAGTRHDWFAYRASGDRVIAKVVDLIALARAELYPLLRQIDPDPLRQLPMRRAAG